MAVNLAVSRPTNGFFGKYNYRVSILTKAPEALAQKAMAEYANKGINILDTLYYEKPFMVDSMPEESPKLWEVIRRAPDGNLRLARITVLWSLRVQSQAAHRGEEHYTWELAQKKWNALSSDDRGKFLTMDILLLSQDIYEKLHTLGEKPSATMDQILQSMIKNASDAWKKELTQRLIAQVKAYPEEKLGMMIPEWFPTIADAVEAHRPKTLFQQAATLFRRS
jgi:hypothetical protein